MVGRLLIVNLRMDRPPISQLLTTVTPSRLDDTRQVSREGLGTWQVMLDRASCHAACQAVKRMRVVQNNHTQPALATVISILYFDSMAQSIIVDILDLCDLFIREQSMT